MQRQIEADPSAAAKLLNTSALGGGGGQPISALSGAGENSESQGEEEKSDLKKKRAPIDK
jgi:hypothetical protein